ncbi:hypothetical protein KR200_008111, partial [Drosophila serrata]
SYRKKISSKFEFTNIKCSSKDKNFVEFEYCYIKSVNRSYKYISMKTRLRSLPINEATARLQILRRFRSFMPITMNVTVEICKFMTDKKSIFNPMLELFNDATKKYTNLNHTCPYDHDIVIDKLPTHYLNQHFTNVLPLPPGEYAFHSIWLIKGIERYTFMIYG